MSLLVGSMVMSACVIAGERTMAAMMALVD